jgi:PTS system sucrose-specific IIC component
MAMKVAATTWGPSGVLALHIMVAGGTSATTQMMCYVVGLVISYIMGFIFTNFSLKAEEVANA